MLKNIYIKTLLQNNSLILNNYKSNLIPLIPYIYITLLYVYTISKIVSLVMLYIAINIYCTVRAVSIIETRNKYIKHIPRATRLNYINYPGELDLKRLRLEYVLTI